jgi:outer membrane receptor for ferrienterochelin and colicin
MKRIFIVFSIYLLICFALAQVDGGHIEGYVFNIQGRPISDVYVVLPELGSADVTTANGYFSIEDIPSGTYVIKLNHISYRSKIIQNVEVYSNSTTTVDTVILESHIFDISDIAVTATRSERSTNRISNQINTVSENEIKARNAKTSAEALREENGIFVQKTNHGGGSAVIRGLSSNQILIMVDGIRLNNSTYRLGNHQYLTTVDNLMASQIEVVRGPTSVLYGSDALGGAINVISKRPSLNHSDFELDFKLFSRFASADLEKTARAEFMLRYNRYALQTGFSYKDYDDLKRGRNSKHPQLENSTNGIKQTPSGFTTYDFDTKLLYGISAKQTLLLAYQISRQKQVPRYDKFENNNYLQWIYQPQHRMLAYLKYENYLKTKIVQSLQATISYHQQEEGREIQQSVTAPFTEENDAVHTLGFSLQMTSIQKNHEITLGCEMYRDRVYSERFITDTSKDSTVKDIRGRYPDNAVYTSHGIFAQDEIALSSSWRAILGTRFSKMKTSFNIVQAVSGSQIYIPYQQDYDSWTGSIGNIFEINENFVLKSHMAQAFRAPNLSDLSKLGESKGEIFEVPNRDLKPEKLLSFDFGFSLRYTLLKLQASVFYTSISDLIGSADATFNELQYIEIDSSQYKIKSKQNIGNAFIRGLEIKFEYQFYKKLQLHSNFTAVLGQNRTLNEPVGGIPPAFGLIGLKWPETRYYLNLYMRFAVKQDRLSSDDRDDPRIPQGGTPAWKIINFRAGFKLAKFIELRFTLENIFDVNYREHGSGINGPGRNFILGLEAIL